MLVAQCATKFLGINMRMLALNPVAGPAHAGGVIDANLGPPELLGAAFVLDGAVGARAGEDEVDAAARRGGLTVEVMEESITVVCLRDGVLRALELVNKLCCLVGCQPGETLDPAGAEKTVHVVSRQAIQAAQRTLE